MSDVHYYETSLKWEEGRIGSLSSDGMPYITVATPPEFPRGVPNTWSPEHLFVASVSVCVMTTFLAIAENSSLEFKSYSAKAKGKLEKIDGKFMVTEIELNPEIVVANDSVVEKAKRIIEKSEKACLISNSIKSKVILDPKIIVE